MSKRSPLIQRTCLWSRAISLCLLFFYNSFASALDIPKRTFKSDTYQLELDYDALFREREHEEGAIVNLVIPGRDYPRISVSAVSASEDSSGPGLVNWLSGVQGSDPKLLHSERRLIAGRSVALHEVRYREGTSILVGLFFDLRIDAQTKYRFWYRDIAASYYTRKPLREQLIAGIRVMRNEEDASQEEQRITTPPAEMVRPSSDNATLIGLVLLVLLIVASLILVRRAR